MFEIQVNLSEFKASLICLHSKLLTCQSYRVEKVKKSSDFFKNSSAFYIQAFMKGASLKSLKIIVY